MSTTALRQLAMDLNRLRNKVDHYRRRIIIEDGWGNKYDLTGVSATGNGSNDLGLVLKIQQRPVHPNA